jgi:hypothetical protein
LLLIAGSLVLAAPWALAETLISPDRGGSSGGSASDVTWSSYGVSSKRSAVAVDSRAARIVLASGDHASLARIADPGAAPNAVLCTFNVFCTGGSGPEATEVVRFGKNFSLSNIDEPDASTYARLGVSPSPNGSGFRVTDFASHRTSSSFTGTQAITWALNNSGVVASYAAPNGAVETLANDRMDVWVGRTKVFDDLAVSTPAGTLRDLKWYWGSGSGVTSIDRFMIGPLGNASGAVVAPPAGDASASSFSAPSEPAGSLELYRPSPNPFERTTRFAYAISGAAQPVDIGVFDVAGRHVRTLVHETQTAGQYETMWNGIGDDGIRSRNGVYFLRASIGSTSRIARIVYLVK